MVNRIVSGAHYGLRDWLAQRISAVVMAVYTLFIVGFILLHHPLGFAEWKALFQHNWVRLFSLLFWLSLLIHAWVGVRDILMDYVHPTGLRLSLQVLAILALVAYGAWAVEVLWS
jgi:succinate dehydrogenase / fumarate reductase membrane anchor subunit